jgi:hypothetical protein
MNSQPSNSLGIRENSLPYSKMIFPPTVVNRLKYGLWRVYTPLHPIVRTCAVTLKIVTPPAQRQNFLIGKLAPNMPIREMIDYLISRGYGNHFVAWKDEGQVVSLRRAIGFEYQYHIRIFSDGEIRGHYEYTPECYPLLHYRAVNQEARRDEFLELFGEKIIPSAEI